MGRQYNQLGLKEREQLDIMHRDGASCSEIAQALGVHKSTVSREIRRHTFNNRDYYLASRAEESSRYRKSRANRHARLKNSRIIEYVRRKLLDDWSPELIAGRLPLDVPGHHISYEAIYQYIYTIPHDGERKEFISHLARRHRERKRKFPGRRIRPSKIPNRISIELRPKTAESRTEPGHWETDSLISRKSKAALNSLTERTSRLLFLSKLSRKGSQETAAAIIDRLLPLPSNLRRTLTLDNGTENCEHERITDATGVRCFFAHPYSAYERGANEHINGLIRRYLPKGTDFATISTREIRCIEQAINQRPRKCLGFKTPLEIASSLGVALPG